MSKLDQGLKQKNHERCIHKHTCNSSEHGVWGGDGKKSASGSCSSTAGWGIPLLSRPSCTITLVSAVSPSSLTSAVSSFPAKQKMLLVVYLSAKKKKKKQRKSLSLCLTSRISKQLWSLPQSKAHFQQEKLILSWISKTTLLSAAAAGKLEPAINNEKTW